MSTPTDPSGVAGEPFDPAELPEDYPSEWEADVLLSDGSTARLRPITPADAALLVEFYARVSPESKYLRFFAPYPVLSDKDVQRFTTVDYRDRVALILTVGRNMVAIGRYDRINATDAEVAFLVEDSQQGKGSGQLLLEHLAEAARERGIGRFVAEVLPQNRRMAQVFADAGYHVTREFEDGLIMVAFDIDPTETSVGVMERREHRAESTSVRRLLQPNTLAIHASSDYITVLVKSLLSGGYHGTIIAVPSDGKPVNGVTNAASIADVVEDIDVVILAVPYDQVPTAVIEAAHRRAFGLVVMHNGEFFAGPANRSVVALVRAYGLRALGPDALGVINTDPAIEMNASPAPMPRPGVVGLFCQSSAVGIMLLSGAIRENLGLANFISTGVHADVTSNDVMQYWEDDDATKVCLLSLDRLGNPRKFSRIVRRLSLRKPVVLFSPGRSQREENLGAANSLYQAPEEAIDAMFRQSGVIVCDRRDAMYDVAQILARQPLPSGERVRVITNSPTLAGHTVRVGNRHGLSCPDPVILPTQAIGADYAAAAKEALADDRIDSVVVTVADLFNTVALEVRDALDELAADSTKPLLGVFADFVAAEHAEQGVDGPGELPTFSGYADAMSALSAVTAYARWRDREHGAVPELALDPQRPREVISAALTDSPDGRRLTATETAEVLRAYGITVVPSYPVNSLEEAVETATTLGWNVLLKATEPVVRGRPDLASVFRYIDSVEELSEAWADLGTIVTELGLEGDEPQLLAKPVIQAMMPAGVSLQVITREDAAFGPIVSLGLSGFASDLLGDVVHRVPPLTSHDASAMVRDLKAAPMLFGTDGRPGVDVASVEELLHRVARLADDFPQLAEVNLAPCIAATGSISVAGARITVAPTAEQRDALSRSLS